jgi:hypothetical protein
LINKINTSVNLYNNLRLLFNQSQFWLSTETSIGFGDVIRGLGVFGFGVETTYGTVLASGQIANTLLIQLQHLPVGTRRVTTVGTFMVLVGGTLGIVNIAANTMIGPTYNIEVTNVIRPEFGPGPENNNNITNNSNNNQNINSNNQSNSNNYNNQMDNNKLNFVDINNSNIIDDNLSPAGPRAPLLYPYGMRQCPKRCSRKVGKLSCSATPCWVAEHGAGLRLLNIKTIKNTLIRGLK